MACAKYRICNLERNWIRLVGTTATFQVQFSSVGSIAVIFSTLVCTRRHFLARDGSCIRRARVLLCSHGSQTAATPFTGAEEPSSSHGDSFVPIRDIRDVGVSLLLQPRGAHRQSRQSSSRPSRQPRTGGVGAQLAALLSSVLVLGHATYER